MAKYKVTKPTEPEIARNTWIEGSSGEFNGILGIIVNCGLGVYDVLFPSKHWPLRGVRDGEFKVLPKGSIIDITV